MRSVRQSLRLVAGTCFVAAALIGATAAPAAARPHRHPTTTTTTTRPTTTTTRPTTTTTRQTTTTTRPTTTTTSSTATTTVLPAPCSAGYVGLTYDDGPTATTSTLLAALAKAHVRATFFDLGKQAEAFPSAVQAEVAGGHAVGNHTYDHQDLTSLDQAGVLAEIDRTQAILAPLTGYVPDLFRPPYGASNAAVWDDIDSRALTTVIWTTDTNDWAGPTTASIVADALTVPPGGAVLMHDGYPNTIAAVPLIAAGLAQRGLCAGRIVGSEFPVRVWDGLDYWATAVPW